MVLLLVVMKNQMTVRPRPPPRGRRDRFLALTVADNSCLDWSMERLCGLCRLVGLGELAFREWFAGRTRWFFLSWRRSRSTLEKDEGHRSHLNGFSFVSNEGFQLSSKALPTLLLLSALPDVEKTLNLRIRSCRVKCSAREKFRAQCLHRWVHPFDSIDDNGRRKVIDGDFSVYRRREQRYAQLQHAGRDDDVGIEDGLRDPVSKSSSSRSGTDKRKFEGDWRV